jgi:hypothetical protein
LALGFLGLRREFQLERRRPDDDMQHDNNERLFTSTFDSNVTSTSHDDATAVYWGEDEPNIKHGRWQVKMRWEKSSEKMFVSLRRHCTIKP